MEAKRLLHRDSSDSKNVQIIMPYFQLIYYVLTTNIVAQIAKVCDVSTDSLLFGISNDQDENNYRTFKRLSECYTPQQLQKALKLAEYYLSLENTTDDN